MYLLSVCFNEEEYMRLMLSLHNILILNRFHYRGTKTIFIRCTLREVKNCNRNSSGKFYPHLPRFSQNWLKDRNENIFNYSNLDNRLTFNMTKVVSYSREHLTVIISAVCAVLLR